MKLISAHCSRVYCCAIAKKWVTIWHTALVGTPPAFFTLTYSNSRSNCSRRIQSRVTNLLGSTTIHTNGCSTGADW